jgi:hypothetical protein
VRASREREGQQAVGVIFRLSTKGNRPEEVITPVPWVHYRNSIK